MTDDEILASIDAAESYAFLQRMVQQKSYSETEGEIRLAGMMRDEMRDLGLEAELVPFGKAGRVNAVGRLPGKGGGKNLLFNGHVDTIPSPRAGRSTPGPGSSTSTSSTGSASRT